MTLSVTITGLPEMRKGKANARGDLVPNQCGEASHDLRRLGGVPKRCWVAIRVRSCDGVLSSHGGAMRRVETARSVETVRACLHQTWVL
ncbi:hypothetical protein DEO72_LG9g941 [Vigna unguiculata]|uniref:Uncharacterized protein n=1 Tax=Vigna unguiculata TaxID=3917 RepID=A0A4D6MZ40_VIGUN|nr:hypothetical protein DEO72_LG9g941 [Vigna unguiculata]